GSIVVEASNVMHPGVLLRRTRQVFRGNGISKETTRDRNDGAAGMRKDELDVRAPGGSFARDETHDGAGCMGWILEGLWRHTFDQIPAAGRFQRMRVYNGLAPIQFIEDWSERGIAQPLVIVAGQESDAIYL